MRSTLPVRKQIRAPGHSYREQDGYFITLVTDRRRPFFGSGARGQVRLNPLGRLVEHGLALIPSIYPHTRLGESVVMPEHVHFILWMDTVADAEALPSRLRWGRGSLGVIVNQLKGFVTKAAVREYGVLAGALWQRGYFDRVIRAGAEYPIRRYIQRHRVPAGPGTGDGMDPRGTGDGTAPRGTADGTAPRGTDDGTAPRGTGDGTPVPIRDPS